MVKQGTKGGKTTSKRSEGQRAHAIQQKAAKANENPFDKFANARKKHEVINRKVKGEDRNMGRAREKAIEERRKRLLGDYQTSKKSNIFEDKRFGESDATLSLEDKMFLRFQKEKTKKARNLAQFNLSEDTEQLTHKGAALGASNYNDEGEFSGDEEAHGGLGRDVVNSLHFGGGLVSRKGGNQDSAQGDSNDVNNGGNRGQSRLDALQEIVMKSKLAKMERKEAKEEQESSRELLDSAFKDIVSAGMLDFKPKGRDRSEVRKEEEAQIGSGDYLGYDTAMRSMAFDAKAAASDRTKTPEEIAVAERKRLEELEAERLRRMRGEPDPAESDAPKKKKLDRFGNTVDASDSEDEDAVEGGEDEEEDGEDEDEEEDGEDEDDEDEEEDDEGEEEDGEDDDEEEDGEEDDEEEEEATKPGKRKAETSIAIAVSKKTSGGSNSMKVAAKCAVSAAATNVVNADMPHVLPCPQDMEQFQEQVRMYVKQPSDFNALVHRIVAYHSVHHPGQLGVDHKGLMHNFLDILMRVFVQLGDALATLPEVAGNSEESDADGVQLQLNGLTAVIFQLCTDLGEAAIPLWGRTVRNIHKQVQKRLRDYAQGIRMSCFPSLGRLLLLRLLAHVFPVSDFRHPIVTPAVLLQCQCLAQCPVVSVQDLAAGLFICGLLTTVYCKETSRFVPEVINFLSGVLRTCGPAKGSRFEILGGGSGTFDLKRLFWISTALGTSAAGDIGPDDEEVADEDDAIEAEDEQGEEAEDEEEDDAEEVGPVLNVAALPWACFSSAFYKPKFGFSRQRRMASAVLSVAVQLCRFVATQQASCAALPELLLPLQQAMRSVPGSAAQETAKYMLDSILRKQQSRVPLQWRAAQRNVVELKAPRYDETYTFQKDRNPDREKAKVKQLNRQLKRETKAAMRELKRDSEFLDAQAFAERQAAHNARKEERAKNYAFMEQQQATINLQVKKQTGVLKGAGSSVAKRAKVKRL